VSGALIRGDGNSLLRVAVRNIDKDNGEEIYAKVNI
jgi:hypothetical protein